MRARPCIALVLLLVLPSVLHAQRNPRIDSLRRALPGANTDTARFDILSQLLDLERGIDSAAAASDLERLGTLRSGHLDSRRLGMIEVHFSMSAHLAGNYDLAKTYAQKAIDIGDRHSDARVSAFGYGMLGDIELEQGHLKEALENFYRELDLSTHARDTFQMGKSNTDLSCVFSDQGDHLRAHGFSREAYRLYSAIHNPDGMAVSAQNMAGYFMSGADSSITESAAMDSALYYTRLGLRAVAGLPAGEQHAQGYFLLAQAFNRKHEQDSAFYYYRRAIEGFRTCGDEGRISFLAQAMIELSDLFRSNGRMDSALSYLRATEAMLKNTTNRRVIDNVYSQLSGAYATMGDFGKAYELLDRAGVLHDSLFSAEKARMLANIDGLYQSSQKEKQLAEQGEALRTQGMMNYGALGLGLVIAAFVVLMVRTNRQQQRANHELEQATARAEESERYEQQFLANMSHEIRTPMNAVLGMTTLLLDTETTPKQREYLEAMKTSSENLLVIINDILDVSKLREGKMELEAVPTRLRDVVSKVLRTMQYKASDKGIALAATLDELLPHAVLADPGRLTQVLLNLVGNAIKFTERGSVGVSVRLLERTDDTATIEFAVTDTGIGIAPQQQAAIFDSFKQAEAGITRKFGGTGLGLSISKTLVELMGSTIRVQSTPGQGSVFSFAVQFPLATDEAESVAPTQAVSAAALAGLRVLLAEDNEYNQIVLVDTLKHLIGNVSIDVADNGLEAVRLAESGSYDIVLMDVQMPVMDGLEATRRIRLLTEERRRAVPIIALTASIVKGDIEQCLAAGMNAYVPKPFKREELLEALARFTQSRTA
ncbi:MAG: response regulator [Bacteroidetes bacterium]|nr:response regulator [Bacteroidota bacterium]